METRRTRSDMQAGQRFTTEAQRHGEEKKSRTTEYTDHTEMKRRGSCSELGRNNGRSSEHSQGWLHEVADRHPCLPSDFRVIRVFRGSIPLLNSRHSPFELLLSVPSCLRGYSSLRAHCV